MAPSSHAKANSFPSSSATGQHGQQTSGNTPRSIENPPASPHNVASPSSSPSPFVEARKEQEVSHVQTQSAKEETSLPPKEKANSESHESLGASCPQYSQAPNSSSASYAVSVSMSSTTQNQRSPSQDSHISTARNVNFTGTPHNGINPTANTAEISVPATAKSDTATPPLPRTPSAAVHATPSSIATSGASQLHSPREVGSTTTSHQMPGCFSISPFASAVLSQKKPAEGGKLGTAGHRRQQHPQRTSSTGRWTKEEHEAFLEGLKIHGREWKKVSLRIPTRTSAQIRSHAQKYFAKLAREQQSQQVAGQHPIEDCNGRTGVGAAAAGVMPQPQQQFGSGDRAPPPSALTQRLSAQILADPSAVQQEVEATMRALQERYRQLQIQLEQRQGQNRRQQRQVNGLERIAEHGGVAPRLAQGAQQPPQAVAMAPPVAHPPQQPKAHLRQGSQVLPGHATAALEHAQAKATLPPLSHIKADNSLSPSQSTSAVIPSPAQILQMFQQHQLQQEGSSNSTSAGVSGAGPIETASSQASDDASDGTSLASASSTPRRELGSEELIAVHVLGDTLPQSASRDSLAGISATENCETMLSLPVDMQVRPRASLEARQMETTNSSGSDLDSMEEDGSAASSSGGSSAGSKRRKTSHDFSQSSSSGGGGSSCGDCSGGLP